MSFKKFIVSFSAFAVIIAVFIALIQRIVSTQVILIDKFWIIYFTTYALTVIAFYVSDKSIKNGDQLSAYKVLGMIVIKLLFFLSLIALYIIKFKVNPILFIANFFPVYFLFTVFELSCLLGNLRHQNKT